MTFHRSVLGLLASACLVVFLGPGCQRPDWLTMHARRIQTLRQRAAFDLECPEGGLTLTPLGTPRQVDGLDFYFEYGVRGCDDRRVYIDANTYNLSEARWVANSD